MSGSFSPIRPKQVPLSHAAPPPRTGPDHGRWLTAALGSALAGGLLVLVFYLLPGWLAGRPATGPAADSTIAPAPAAPAEAASPAAEDPALPPYQQLQREQAREKAQQELAHFVERQIQLEDSMQVGTWGADRYDQAKDRAAAGDDQFVREQFTDAIASYQAATEALQTLIDDGHALLEDAIARGGTALAARDGAGAAEALDLAATIAPDDPRVAAGRARLAVLPQIGTLMREARNHELSGEWSQAADTYAEIRRLDPQVADVEEALARVAEGRRRAHVQDLLSQAFADLDAQRFDAARSAFNKALSIEPGNAVAMGGLEQVAKRADVVRINALRERADRALAEERWADSTSLYGEVLEIDPTIQFALSGRAVADTQQRTQAALARILQNPEKLSSDRLYRQAQDILERASTLEPRGPQLARQIEDVGSILDAYATPVPVLLRSDNRTEVTLSTVGTLGSFEEKRLELRPGSYTVVGSRDGCRDVRAQIVVRPNMNPVDIRCSESL